MKIVPKVWGSELWIVNNSLYCGKILKLNKGWQGSRHYHKIKTETFYVLKGMVRLELGGEAPMILYPGGNVTIQPGTPHRFAGIEDSEIVEFSTTHDDRDTYRETESGPLEQVDMGYAA